MAQLDTRQKLEILADAAKYDASCASSGTSKRNSLDGKGIGSTEGMGICHAYAPDGRCISLLKILLTNSCIFDCHYCINRKSSNVRRARFTPEEEIVAVRMIHAAGMVGLEEHIRFSEGMAVAARAALEDGAPLILKGGVEVSVAYFRAGYTPRDYPGAREWQAREMLELSMAIKMLNKS